MFRGNFIRCLLAADRRPVSRLESFAGWIWRRLWFLDFFDLLFGLFLFFSCLLSNVGKGRIQGAEAAVILDVTVNFAPAVVGYFSLLQPVLHFGQFAQAQGVHLRDKGGDGLVEEDVLIEGGRGTGKSAGDTGEDFCGAGGANEGAGGGEADGGGFHAEPADASAAADEVGVALVLVVFDRDALEGHLAFAVIAQWKSGPGRAGRRVPMGRKLFLRPSTATPLTRTMNPRTRSQ